MGEAGHPLAQRSGPRSPPSLQRAPQGRGRGRGRGRGARRGRCRPRSRLSCNASGRGTGAWSTPLTMRRRPPPQTTSSRDGEGGKEGAAGQHAPRSAITSATPGYCPLASRQELPSISPISYVLSPRDGTCRQARCRPPLRLSGLVEAPRLPAWCRLFRQAETALDDCRLGYRVREQRERKPKTAYPREPNYLYST